MLTTVLSTAEAFGAVTGIKSPKGHLAALLADLSPDLAALAVEGDDALLHVEAGGRWWSYGGLV